MKTVLVSLYLHVVSIAGASTLRGPIDEISKRHVPYTNNISAVPDFNCFRENAEFSCKESTASDSSNCVWCSMTGGGGAAGACLSNEEAIVANGQFGLSCPLEIYVEPVENKVKTRLPDMNCFKAAWVAENAETACGESKDKDGKACVWCQTDGDVAGACLSRPEAGMANGQLGLTCPSNDEDFESLEYF